MVDRISALTPVFKRKKRFGEIALVNSPPGTPPPAPPISVTLVGSITDSTNLDGPGSIVVNDTTAYIAGTGYLTTVDITDLSSPTVSDKYVTASIIQGSQRHDLTTGGNHVIAGANGRIWSFDVSDPTNILLEYESAFKTGYGGTTIVIGDYAFVLRDDYLTVVDVSDPTTFSETYFANNALFGGRARYPGSGDIVYTLNGSDSRVGAVDVSVPTAPVLLDTLVDTRFLQGSIAVPPAGDVLYVGKGGTDQLTAVDVSDPSNMSVISSVTDNTHLNGVSALVADDEGFVYVAAGVGNRLTVFDCRDTTDMSWFDIEVIDSNRFDFQQNMFLYNDHIHVPDRDNDIYSIWKINR